MEDILLDDTNDIIIQNGDFAIGDSLTQEVGLILGLTQGTLNSDPVLGPNLFLLMKSTGNKETIATRVKLHLARDGKNYDELKEMIKINAKNH